ncbi:PepSY-like domain-containing protein [Cesiribacter sp. SM1]|uniref:PepSY-like domain-containing protein n=1 Tax=Cesiribacter sp. SM1 TaxID=2861196 RepID=UPI001CD40633|nr:PepSY-like domain-containing protein [Cesiribacter sp. SM1]
MMKSTIYLLAVLSLCAFSCEDDLAQKDVPEAVQAGFSAGFPEAARVEWEKAGERYEVEFIFNNLEHEAILSTAGEVLKFKHDVQATDLPEAVKNSISQNYSGMMISDPEKVQQGNQEYYQLELEKEEQEMHLVFSTDGQQQSEPTYWD